MKKIYETPEMKIVIMTDRDVVTESGDNDSPFPLKSTLAASDMDIILS